MKDYAVDSSDKAKFILKYDIITNNIIVTFADGHNEEFTYTREQELKLLEQMKKQYEKINKEKLFQEYNRLILFIILSSTNSISSMYNITSFNRSEGDYILLTFFLLICGGCSLGLKSKYELIHDYKKLTFFMQNLSLFEEEYNLNINIIDNMTLKELKKIKNKKI